MVWLWGLWLACAAPQPVPEAPEPEAPAVAVEALAYEMRVFGGEDTGEALPTVIAVHGRGDSADRFVGFVHGVQAKVGPVRVIAPRAPMPFREGATWFSSSYGDAAARGQEMLVRADQVAALIDTLSARGLVAGKPVVTGFSQGGMVSFAMALRHPDKVAGTVPVGGWLPSELVPSKPTTGQKAVRILALHGADDNVVPTMATRRAVDQLRAAGFQAEMQVFPGVGHSVPAGVHAQVLAHVASLLGSTGHDKP